MISKEDECTGFVDFVIEEEDHHKRNRADARKHKSRRLFHKNLTRSKEIC